MFEVGQFYWVRMWEDSDEDKGGIITEYGAAQVIEVSLPLVKFKNIDLAGGGETIVNTASLAFVSATIAKRD
jgi:hypothetical protein